MLGNISHTSIQFPGGLWAAPPNFCYRYIQRFPFLLGASRGPSLKEQLYHSTNFSTVKRQVLMFTKHLMFVHKIYDFAPSGPDGAKIIGIFLR